MTLADYDGDERLQRVSDEWKRHQARVAEFERDLAERHGEAYVEEVRQTYRAQESAVLDSPWTWGDEDGDFDPDDFGPDDIEPLIVAALQGAGWDPDRRPAVHLDVADDDWQSGYVDDDGDLHFHPRMLNRMTVLHELAHSLGPVRRAHGDVPSSAGATGVRRRRRDGRALGRGVLRRGCASAFAAGASRSSSATRPSRCSGSDRLGVEPCNHVGAVV